MFPYLVVAALIALLAIAMFDVLPPRATFFRRGGLYFWRIGRLGGSFYWSRMGVR